MTPDAVFLQGLAAGNLPLIRLATQAGAQATEAHLHGVLDRVQGGKAWATWLPVLRFLVEHGADPTREDGERGSALARARREQAWECYWVLRAARPPA